MAANVHCDPMYDSYVDKVLWRYQKQEGFSAYKHKELKRYSRFVDVIGAFRSDFRLEGFLLKDVDNFLWSIGKESVTGEQKPIRDMADPAV